MNIVTLAGYLGADAELRKTTGGTSMCKLRLATTERQKSGNEWKDFTEWHTVVIWGSRAESLAPRLTKGVGVAVSGKLRTRSWEDRDGQKKYTTEIIADNITVFADRSRERTDRSGTRQAGKASENEGEYEYPSFGKQDHDDGIPF